MTEALATNGDVAVPVPPVDRDASVPAEMAVLSVVDASGRPWPVFAHASEAEMARILDFYAVRWDYEPRTFPILWNLDGDVVESFSPDFYLPELDLYLEMTTLKQRLVRKKNRKLRRLRELYPAINVKLFYARDFRAMMLKYGRLALADSLSGTLGQISPERPASVPIDAPDPAVAIERLIASPNLGEILPSRTDGRRRARRSSSPRGDMLASVRSGSSTTGSPAVPSAVMSPDEEGSDHR